MLRTTSQSRIYDSEINWSLGFFGTSFETVPNPDIANASTPFDLVIMPKNGSENNTLAAYDSCPNNRHNSIVYMGVADVFLYIPNYLHNATTRLQQYAPSGFTLNTNDTYAM